MHFAAVLYLENYCHFHVRSMRYSLALISELPFSSLLCFQIALFLTNQKFSFYFFFKIFFQVDHVVIGSVIL